MKSRKSRVHLKACLGYQDWADCMDVLSDQGSIIVHTSHENAISFA